MQMRISLPKRSAVLINGVAVLARKFGWFVPIMAAKQRLRGAARRHERRGFRQRRGIAENVAGRSAGAFFFHVPFAQLPQKEQFVVFVFRP